MHACIRAHFRVVRERESYGPREGEIHGRSCRYARCLAGTLRLVTEMESLKDQLIADCKFIAVSDFFSDNTDFIPFVPCVRTILPQLPKCSNSVTRQVR